MKIDGQILLNTIPICETFKISCLMGEHNTRDFYGKPFKGPIIPFGSFHCLFLRKTSQESINLEKVLPGLFLGYALYAGGIWKGDILIADLEELETMDASEIYSKRLHAKEVILPKEKGEFFQLQMDESNFLVVIRT